MPQHHSPQGSIAWVRIVFMVVVLLLGFTLGRWSTTFGPDLQAAIDKLQDENRTLKESTISKDTEIEQCRKVVYSLDPELTGAENPLKVSETSTADGQTVKTYLVKENDTLSSIAGTVYANQDLYGAIRDANNISSANPLQVGKEIVIPPLEEAVAHANEERKKKKSSESPTD